MRLAPWKVPASHLRRCGRAPFPALPIVRAQPRSGGRASQGDRGRISVPAAAWISVAAAWISLAAAWISVAAAAWISVAAAWISMAAAAWISVAAACISVAAAASGLLHQGHVLPLAARRRHLSVWQGSGVSLCGRGPGGVAVAEEADRHLQLRVAPRTPGTDFDGGGGMDFGGGGMDFGAGGGMDFDGGGGMDFGGGGMDFDGGAMDFDGGGGMDFDGAGLDFSRVSRMSGSASPNVLPLAARRRHLFVWQGSGVSLCGRGPGGVAVAEETDRHLKLRVAPRTPSTPARVGPGGTASFLGPCRL